MRRLITLLLLLMVTACGGGPDGEALRKDVEERLAQALPAGTVALATFERRGSQSDTKAPSGETRRIIYFDAELKLERDFDFGAWDAPGVAGIISALGAGPKGVSGITSGGNKAEAAKIWDALSKDNSSSYAAEARVRLGELSATPAR